MKPRAVIFDIYGTLLELAPASGDAQAGWQQLFNDFLQAPPRLALAEFAAACGKVIARQHAAGQSRGILCPEIVWPSVVCQVLPELSSLPSVHRDEFIFRERQLTRTALLNRAAAGLLVRLRRADCWLGIASNAQAYTIRELGQAFAAAGLDWKAFFEPQLCFWSFEHGFSKPNPHVFQVLTARLQARDVIPGETLMIGDRLDNDIEPATAHGWQSWWLTASPQLHRGGDWQALHRALAIYLRNP